MKPYKTILVVFAICTSVLSAEPASVEALSTKVSILEERVASLESELAMTQSYLREISRVTMTDRLVITVTISEKDGIAISGVGFDGRDLGGTAIEHEDFIKQIRSITDDYAKPKLVFSGDSASPDFEANYQLFQQLSGRAGIFSATISDRAKPTQ